MSIINYIRLYSEKPLTQSPATHIVYICPMWPALQESKSRHEIAEAIASCTSVDAFITNHREWNNSGYNSRWLPEFMVSAKGVETQHYSHHSLQLVNKRNFMSSWRCIDNCTFSICGFESPDHYSPIILVIQSFCFLPRAIDIPTVAVTIRCILV